MLFRDFQIRQDKIDEEKRTVEMSFSSELPYERWFGYEVLDHSEDAVNLDRLNDGGPLLLGHDHGDQIGVIENAWIDGDRKGRAVVRFSKSQHADEIFADVLDGIRRNVSVGYMVENMVLLESGKDAPDTYLVDRWQPHEVSVVPVPADNSVGIGRQIDAAREYIERQFLQPIDTKTTKEGLNMDPKDKNKKPEPKVVEVRDEAYAKSKADDARVAERNRIADITTLADRFDCRELGKTAIENGTSVADFRGMLLDTVGDKLENQPISTERPEVGMSDKDVSEYSFIRMIRAQAENNPQLAPFELEASNAVAQKMGRSPRGFFVPMEVLQRNILQRDMVVGTDGAGGYLKATDLLSGSFIEMLINRMMVRQMGAITLTGLVGDVAIPAQTAGATAYWVAESGDPTESQQTIAQVTMAPKTVGAFTDISRKLLLQSSIDIEAFVVSDLATTLALAIDLAAINGSGASNQPTGVLNTSNIGDVAGGANGLAPTWAHVVELETDVAVANADVGTLGYLTNAKVRGKLKTTDKGTDTGQFVWGDAMGDGPGWGSLNGYRAGVSNQVPSNLDKGTSTGVCSAIIFGNWADLVIGAWGALDVLIDPYTGSTSGTVRVVNLQDVDIACRHAASFSAMQDALTA